MSAGGLVIDARKAFDAGIGTYVRGVVPRVVERLRDVPIDLLVRDGKDEDLAWAATVGAKLVRTKAPPFSAAEQLELRRRAARDRLFWATSLAHPLLARTPLFATVHDLAQVYGGARVTTWQRSVAVKAWFRSLLRAAVGAVCVSRYTCDQLRRFCGGDLRFPVTVTPLGVDPAWRPQPQSRRGEPYFVYVGSVRPHKNVVTLVRAFDRVAARLPHRLVIAGDASGTDAELRSVLADVETRRPGRVAVAGQVPFAALVRLVAGATALVFPSRYEGFGLPALEAMAAGCPVVAAGVTSLPEVAGEVARYFDPESVSQLATLLVEVATMSPTLRQALSDAGRRRSESFTWDRCAEATAESLRDCLRRVARPG